MMSDEKIKGSRELEFVVFCIENVAAKLGVNAEKVYRAFTEKSDMISGFYVTPLYEQAVKWCGKFKRRGKQGIVF